LLLGRGGNGDEARQDGEGCGDLSGREGQGRLVDCNGWVVLGTEDYDRLGSVWIPPFAMRLRRMGHPASSKDRFG
jgi:hypothetical protein